MLLEKIFLIGLSIVMMLDASMVLVLGDVISIGVWIICQHGTGAL